MSGRCGRCEVEWKLTALCHCKACCRSFSGLQPFDKHRVAFECREPASRGLFFDEERGWWCTKLPLRGRQEPKTGGKTPDPVSSARSPLQDQLEPLREAVA